MKLCLSEQFDFPKGFFKEFRRAEIIKKIEKQPAPEIRLQAVQTLTNS